MAAIPRLTMLIYHEDAEFLKTTTLCHPNIETGGDLFGLWQSESEVVIQLVTGPGKNCRRTPTAFYQDQTYLARVGNYLVSSKGLCNMGEWHSHHRLNLPTPSGGDKATVWRNMTGLGLKRFLLIIATITQTGEVSFNGFMLTPPRGGNLPGGMERVETRILHGASPFRSHPDVVAKLRYIAERPDLVTMTEISQHIDPTLPDAKFPSHPKDDSSPNSSIGKKNGNYKMRNNPFRRDKVHSPESIPLTPEHPSSSKEKSEKRKSFFGRLSIKRKARKPEKESKTKKR